MASCGTMFARTLFRCSSSKFCQYRKISSLADKFTTNFKLKNIRERPLRFFAAGLPVTVAGYFLYKYNQTEPQEIIEPVTKEHTFLESKPQVPVSRVVNGSVNDFDLNLTLFQYPTCPFCCKVRAFLDYYGLPYEVVEVDPVLRQQTSWTTYKKVPILLAQVENGYQQLNDSTMIISALQSFILNKSKTLQDILSYYPIIEYKDKGEVKSDILNKYFLMFNENVPKEKTSKVVLEEKEWREWADNVLVHTLSPNVYRTHEEAMQAFRWFSEVGEWNKLFPWWEQMVIVHMGAFAMWIISKRLKKRHRLKEDVRESLYDECKKWMKVISKKKTTFMGGKSPNLADLAVYGVLSSIEGCLAFKDLLEYTSIGKWYFPMKEVVNKHEGKNLLKL